MKSLFLGLAFCAAPALAQTPTSTPAPTFDWKLRLTKGQSWTQTVTTQMQSHFNTPTAGGAPPMNFSMNLVQTIGFKNEVLDAAPTFYLIRSTYQRFDQKQILTVNGKVQPVPAMPELSKAFEGASFTIKQAPDGRVLEVTGLEDFVTRQRKVFGSLGKTPQERASFAQFLPSVEALRASISRNQGVSLPKTPLAVGQSYSYALAMPAMSTFVPATQVNNRRTLRSLDSQTATFDENTTYNFGAPKAQVVAGVKLYMAMKGTISGSSHVQVASGLPLGGALSMQLVGKITTIDKSGKRTTLPISATSKITSSTTF